MPLLSGRILRLTPALALLVVVIVTALVGALLNRSDRQPDRHAEIDRQVIAGSTDFEPTSYTSPILNVMKNLESARDPKCHSTACRFEDFIFGTPLTVEARTEKVNLQKALISDIWARASATANQAGENKVRVDHIQPWIDEALSTEVSQDGNIRVLLRDRSSITLSQVRSRQYASIAYSLRAILSVQQDFLFHGGDRLLTLEPESVDALRSMLDILTLSALMIADQSARNQNIAQITKEFMRDAWQRVVHEVSNTVAQGNVDSNRYTAASEASKKQGLQLLQALINEKISAYEAYNKVSIAQTADLFVSNARRFYARYPLPMTSSRGRNQLWDTYHATMIEFAKQLLFESQRAAKLAGHSLVRASDANDALQKLIPHGIDDFEHILFFTHLVDEKKVMVESYDCDSWRDLGLHWRYLQDALDDTNSLSITVDPFAAEIITEGISQYGVLVFRLAGRTAKQRHKAPVLEAEDLRQSEILIRDLAERHHSTNAPVKEPSRIVSSTASGAVDPNLLFFTDVTSKTGVRFVHRSSKWLSEFRRTRTSAPPTFSGGGVAAEDVNNDSYTDLLFVGGTGNALLINDGRGYFRDITDSAGLRFTRSDGTPGEARKPIIADFDNDGLQDIFITYADDDHRLYRNLDHERFEDVTERAGLGGDGLIGGPATAFDFDGDGLLDIYIGYFGDYINGAIPELKRNNDNALPNQLFRNLGGLQFEDVTTGSGTADTGWTQAVSHIDFDRDGLQDIIVANDFGLNAFLRNLGNGRFENVANALGITEAYQSMNVGISDLNGDGFPDVYISNIATFVKDNKYVLPDVNTPLDFNYEAMGTMLVLQSNMLYMSRAQQGRLHGYEPSKDVERGPTSTGWAWDAEFFDFDHDGDDDLYVVNGTNEYMFFSTTVSMNDKSGQPAHYLLSHDRESNVFFVNQAGKLKNLSPRSGADFTGNSRSTAYLDFDNDGDLDIAVNNFHAPATMLQNNVGTASGNWVMLRLEGDPGRGTNRDAIGSRVLATTETGLRIHRVVQGGSGYLSMNPKQLHFGVATAKSVDLTITWANGETQTIAGLDVGRSYTVRQGHDYPRPSPLVDGPGNSALDALR